MPKNSWAELLNNRFSRHFGGTKIGVADPYVSGYFWVWFTDLPAKLPDYVGLNIDEIKSVLSATCTAVTTIPAFTLNKVTSTGLGGLKYSVPGNIDIGDEFAVRFKEFSGLPVFKILHGWTKMIRDYRTGVSHLQGDDYTKSQYSCTIFYWTTKPDGKTIEFSACYTGCFPARPNEDVFAHDVTATDEVQLETSFNVDIPYVMEDWVIARCQTLMDVLHKDTASIYARKEGV